MQSRETMPTTSPAACNVARLPGALQVVLASAAYAMTAWLGLQLATLHESVSPVWPASGVGIAAVVLFGRRAAIGIAVAALAVHAASGAAITAAIGIAIGNTLEACTGAWIVTNAARQLASLGPAARPITFVLAAAVAPVVSACIGVASLALLDSETTVPIMRLGLTWWSGSALGILITVPLLLSLAEDPRALLRPTPSAVCKIFTVALLAVGACTLAFDEGAPSLQQFLLFPIVLLAAFWFGRVGGLATTAGITTYLVITTAHAGHGHGLTTDLLWLDVFLAGVAITALFLGEFLRTVRSPPAAIVLLGGWVLSSWLYANLQASNAQFDQLRLERLAREAENAIQQRLTTYADALHAGASLHAASQSVELLEWRAFAESLDMLHRYPGIHGIGVIHPVTQPAAASFVSHRRADGQPDFSIHPVPTDAPPLPEAGDAEHFVITFIEPIEPNREAVGLDVGSERNRRNAACLARDTGRATITGHISLVQDGQQRPGFLLYVPMYRKGSKPANVAERRREFEAWIYAPFITEVFLQGVLGGSNELDLHFYDGAAPSHDGLLCTTDGVTDAHAAEYDLLSGITLGGRTFTLGWRRTDSFERTMQGAPMLVAASLALVSLLLAGLVLSLQSVNRSTKLAAQRTRDLEVANASLNEQIQERELAQTEADRARAAAELANRSKSAFLATMSHEIRTPMNSVIGFAGLLMRSPMSSEQHSWATLIEASGRTLLALINDILDFSKIEAGKMSMERVPFSPVVAAQEAVGLMTPHADTKHLQLLLAVQSQPPRLVLGDPGRFSQVLLNLISNALKFTLSGKVCIEISFRADSDDEGMLRVAVVDTGIGIPADKVPSLFEEFSQADSSTTRRYGGTGLGLAICKRIVELMHGSITVTSEEDSGSTFAFEVPMELAAIDAVPGKYSALELDADTGDAESDSPKDITATTAMRILVAEDVTANQILVRALLQRHGALVDIADNGKIALALSNTTAYDLILMDCQMPVLDGFDATQAIRARENSIAGQRTKRRTPIIAITANALEGDRERCLAAGMDDYISKPIRPIDLDRALHRWLPDLSASD